MLSVKQGYDLIIQMKSDWSPRFSNLTTRTLTSQELQKKSDRLQLELENMQRLLKSEREKLKREVVRLLRRIDLLSHFAQFYSKYLLIITFKAALLYFHS
jgi:hypothetical protein